MITTKKIYMVSGLGADKRTFQYLNLIFQKDIIHLDWVKPFRNEKLSSYCQRLIETYEIKSARAIIGLSFGGIIAQEIAKQIDTQKIILISSVRTKQDLPKRYRIAGKLGLTKLIPKRVLGKSNYFVERNFGLQNDSERKLLRQILNETDPDFAYWAINAIANWNNVIEANNTIRIHGTKDKILPLRNQVNFKIKNAGHFMVVQNAEEISQILNTELEE